MIYKDKILFNPTSKDFEFMCQGRLIQFAPGEKRLTDGYAAHHALVTTNTPLVEYDGQDSEPMSDFSEMPWRQLISLAAKEGIDTFGKKRPELEALLKEKDASKEGTISESAGEEEA